MMLKGTAMVDNGDTFSNIDKGEILDSSKEEKKDREKEGKK